MGFEQVFGLLLEMVEMGTGGQLLGHRDTLFLTNACGPPQQTERRSISVFK